MSANKEIVDLLNEIREEFRLAVADVKAELVKATVKKTTRSTTTRKTSNAVSPSGERFPPNYMTWFRREYRDDPEKTIEAFVPEDVKGQLEDFKNSGDEKYMKKNAQAKLNAEATFLWKALDDDEIKKGIKKAYLEAKAEFEKKNLEPATVEGGDDTPSNTEGDDSTNEEEVVINTKRKARTKRALVAD